MSRIRTRLGAITAAAALAAAGLAAPPAFAADIPTSVGNVNTLFEIDGDMAGTNDWDGVLSGAAYGPYTTAEGDPSTGILGYSSGEEYCATEGVPTQEDPSMFPGSQTIDADPWIIGTGNVNKKSDLCSAGSAYEIVDVDGEAHIIFYQFWNRSADGTGDLTVYQEFTGPQAGRGDDLLIEFNYDANGGGAVDIQVLRWNGTSWVPGTGSYQADYGTNGVDGNVGTFGEMAVDLTDSGIFSHEQCDTFTSGQVMSRTGNSQQAQLQDTMSPPPLVISDCNDLTVTKETTGPVPEDLLFSYVIEQADGMPVHADGLVGPVADEDASNASITASIGAGESHTWQNLFADPDYLVRELTGDLPAGVSLDTVVCTYTNLFEAGAPVESVVLYENGASTGAVFPMFPHTVADAPSCVITNAVTSLTLEKIVTNDHGGTLTVADFTLTAEDGGGNVVLQGTDPDPAPGIGLTGLVEAGDYTLSEETAAGYDASDWVCTGGELNGNVVTVAVRTSVTCTITNDDRPAHLTLIKQVVNDDGGTATTDDFPLTATGPVTITGVTDDPEITGAEIPAGAYDLSEIELDGYAAGSWSCEGGTLDGSTLALANDESATCTIVNDDIAPRLTLVKEVVNDHGGTATEEDFPLTAEGPDTVTGISDTDAVTDVAVTAGDYALSEETVDGYTASDWSCTDGSLDGAMLSLGVGDVATCTIVNDDDAAHLTLVKNVINDHGGTATEEDFPLTAEGPDTVTGISGTDAVTNVPVASGAYDLSEVEASGYAAGDWSCEGGSLDGSTVSLGLGESATCEITNDDIAPRLTLEKIVTNDHGGSATIDDFPLTAEGPVTITGISGEPEVTDVPVEAGSYVLSEENLENYDPSTWTCTGGGELDGDTVAIGLAENVTCTIINDDAAAHLTLIKQVINDDGGTATTADFTLTAEGPLTISGVTDDPEITDAMVAAGDYALSEVELDGYAAGSWSCEGGSLEGSTVSLDNGESAVCTIVNDDIAPRLTLVKNIINDDGGTATEEDFPLTAEGPVTITGVSGTDAVTNVAVEAGAYELSEVEASGYTASGWSCEGGSLEGSTVALALAENVVCTILNDDQPAQLSLVKTVINDDGGPATEEDFPLTAEGPTTISGISGTDAVTNVTVPAGTYDLSEVEASGYAPSDWSCEGGSLDGSAVTIANGQSAVCEIVNDDIAPSLTLVKEVVNDHGGPATEEDFPLTAEGPTTISGISGTDAVTNVTVPAGTYDLSEVMVDGYTAGDWSCEGGSLDGSAVSVPLATDVVCTIINDDIAPTLTLVKEVTNDHGGQATVEDFILTAEGPVTISGISGTPEVTDQVVVAGDYLLSEDGPSAYTGAGWSCTAGTLEGDTLTLGIAQHATCTILNDDDPAHLTLVKNVINDHGGTAAPEDFDLSADGAVSITGPSGSDAVTNVEVPQGTYALSEEQLDGYELVSIVCWATNDMVDELEVEDAAIALANGESAYCVLTNDDIAPRLTLEKTVRNNNGGTATVVDFPLTGEGPLTLSGISGSDDVTDVAVSAGTYELSEEMVDGYHAGLWHCEGGTLDGTSLTLSLADAVVCEIVNDDIAPSLTLVKEVINDDGGTATTSDFPLTAEGPDTVTGISGSDEVTGVVVDAGSYELSELMVDGYAAGEWSCEGGTLDGSAVSLALAADVVCTIVNDDIAPSLTLVKEVVNDHGGNATEEDFPLTAEGPDTVTGISGTDDVTDVAVPAGTYDLSEVEASGYAAGDWSCEGGTLDGSAVSVPLAANVVCTIVNDDLPIDLAIEKTSSADRIPRMTPFDFTLTITNVGERDADLDEPVTVTDTLPAGIELLSAPEGCEAADGIVSCELDPAALTVGGSVELVLTVQFTGDAETGSVTNIAVVDTPDDPAPADPDCTSESNNVDCDVAELVEGDLAASKAVFEKTGSDWEESDGNVDFGDTVQFEITVVAGGDAPSTDIVITDRLVDGLTDAGGAACDVDCDISFDEDTASYTVEIDELAPGDTARFRFLAVVPDAPAHAAGTSITRTFGNIAAVSSSDTPEFPTNPVEVSAEDTLPEEPPLAATGGTIPWPLLGTGAALLAAGLLLAIRRRHHQE
ncbi:DUF11 domain-containing protein [Microbacterium suaedae]|uniref:DUF11 domain-containing protein n=1 Tax=Microbacterium suaedae TaxID=2067813 RepID=UPI000DA21D19|nr:DUF11 domain-containing protein [Microbacterium suaedae]